MKNLENKSYDEIEREISKRKMGRALLNLLTLMHASGYIYLNIGKGYNVLNDALNNGFDLDSNFDAIMQIIGYNLSAGNYEELAAEIVCLGSVALSQHYVNVASEEIGSCKAELERRRKFGNN